MAGRCTSSILMAAKTNYYSTLLLLLLTIFFNLNYQTSFCYTETDDDHCSTPSCNPDEAYFHIHFPFRIPLFKSNPTCAYNDLFTLSCAPNNKLTLIHFPNAGSFAVDFISYYDQCLYINDPNNCFPQRIFDGFDLSGSPFTFSTSFLPQTYTYYNCTYISPHYYNYLNPIDCMNAGGAANNYTIATMSGGPQNVTNCTVMKTVSGPRIYGGSYDQKMSIQLCWSEPACETCLSNHGICGFKKHSRTNVVCHSSKGHGLSSGAKYALILGISIPAFFIIIILLHRRTCRSVAAVEQSRSETQLMPVRTTTNQAANNITMGLDGPTIESYPKFVLDKNDALLEPNIGPCAICLCEYKAQDMLRTIPDCNHYFHSDCVDEWLKLNATCPICRKV